ncbi:GNAT family N-acetyltransferase [Cellulomonas wangsupingiae]|uniref:GNAT family N-acetyltransferase n=1 Tax=Cellulomonas wangsupingiae TaxID=2968085 RepID=A0ABY5K4Z5_9CELL|nr:GNAT family N-acetyltransferase [Cellulomonas wangsupingiae]MCC2335037.1 GNAT family N-acetyltransferase [Cellulomonas wangsupingiae]UUI65536.1 GNAT family N-acetyltransferase [Cellulomonas wangsupingiae]
MAFTPMPARLDTERFVLTPEEPSDVPWLAELFAARGAGAVTPDQAWQRMVAAHERTRPHGIGVYVLRPRDGTAPVGYVGLVVGRCTVEEPELAYELLPAAHGRGSATEAARAILDAAFATGRDRIWATLRESNAASLRVLAKLGGFAVRRVTADERGRVLWHVREQDA